MSFFCDTCSSIFQKHHELPPDNDDPFKFGEGKFKLYQDVTQLLASAETGCVVCLRIRHQMSRRWWECLVEDLKLKLSISDRAWFEVEWALQMLGNNLRIQIKLWAGLSRHKSIVLRTLSLIVVKKDDVMAFIDHESLGCRTDSPSTGAKAKNWLSRCTQNHPICSRELKESSFRPTRLLYIGDAANRVIKLCSSSTILLDSELRYTSLSHRWGDLKIIRLLTSNIDLFHQEIEVGILPRTFVEAINFTRYIGIEYIWIDSLCIIQDDGDDWRYEAARMGDVYRFSWCNIAATGFEDSKRGMIAGRDPRVISPIAFTRKVEYKKPKMMPFAIQVMPTFGPSGSEYDPPVKFHSHAKEQARRQKIFPDGDYICFNEDFWDRGITDAPLSSRGWVFQERLLSPRTIHFGLEQMFWECREIEACESFPDGLPRGFHEGRTYKSRRSASALPSVSNSSELDLALTTWNSILASYTATTLTKQSDRLPAISGVAKDLQGKLDSPYLAGLWKNWLIYQLLWSIQKPDEPGIDLSGAPSWTWAATAGTVKGSSLVDSPQLSRSLVAKVTDAQVDNSGDEMSHVLEGTIMIEGVLIRLFPTPEKFDWRKYPQKIEDTLTPFLFFWPYGTREYTKYSAEADGKRQGVEINPKIYLDMLPWPEEVYLLPIVSHAEYAEGLVLTPVNAKELNGPWKRRGKFDFANQEKGARAFAQLIADLQTIHGEDKTILLT